jgi:hypothetical protein
MLELLALREGTTLTNEMFPRHLCGGMDEPKMKIVDVFICLFASCEKTRQRIGRQGLYRDDLGARLCSRRMPQAHRSGSNPPSGSDWVRYRSMSALAHKRTWPCAQRTDKLLPSPR